MKKKKKICIEIVSTYKEQGLDELHYTFLKVEDMYPNKFH